jgi:hypothetical protein
LHKVLEGVTQYAEQEMSRDDADSLYVLLKTAETDVAMGDDRFAVRVELFQNFHDTHQYRALVWRTELYRMQSSFPRDDANRPMHRPSDEQVLVDWSFYLEHRFNNFRAETSEDALQAVLADVRAAMHKARGD